MLQWWLYRTNGIKLLLYSSSGCKGEVVEMERRGSRHVKVTLDDGSYLLRRPQEYMFNHGNIPSIRCPDDILPFWKMFNGKYKGCKGEVVEMERRGSRHVKVTLDDGSYLLRRPQEYMFNHGNIPSIRCPDDILPFWKMFNGKYKVNEEEADTWVRTVFLPVKPPRIVVGDSLTRGIEIPGCKVACFPGATPASLTQKMRDVQDLERYQAVLIHVGTNCIEKYKPTKFAADYKKLVKAVKDRHPTSKVLLTSILPRPRDFVKREQIVNHANLTIRNIASSMKRDGVKFVNTRKRFIHKQTKTPVNHLFRRDGLHLSDAGQYQLKRSFTQALNHAFH